MLVAAGILIFLAIILLDALTAFRETSALDQAVDSTIGYLREAREKTLGSENASVYGVHFTPTAVTYFRGGVYDPADALNVVHTLSAFISISSIALSTTTANIVFDRLTGESSVTGTITFSAAKSGRTKTIQIFSSGLTAKQ